MRRSRPAGRGRRYAQDKRDVSLNGGNGGRAERRSSLAEDVSEEEVAAAPTRRVIAKMPSQERATRDGMVAPFVLGGLEGVEKSEEVEKHTKERREEDPGDGSLPLDEAGAGVFIR
jgi:hypothetical protein